MASSLLRAVPRVLPQFQAVRYMSTGDGVKAFSDRESAYENVYFTKEDQVRTAVARVAGNQRQHQGLT